MRYIYLMIAIAFTLMAGPISADERGFSAPSATEKVLEAFEVTIEVVVPKGTNALAFVPNSNRSNFADGREAIGIALLTAGDPFPLDDNFVIQQVILPVPEGMTEGVLCTGHVPGVGHHAYFASDIVKGWRNGEPLKGLAAVISSADRARLGPRVKPIEQDRGYPKKIE